MVTSDSLHQAMDNYKQYAKPYMNIADYQQFLPQGVSVASPAQDILQQTLANTANASQSATNDVIAQEQAKQAAAIAAQNNSRLSRLIKLQGYQPTIPSDPNALTGLQDAMRPVKGAPVARAFGENNKPGVAFDTERGDQIRAIANGVVQEVHPDGTIVMRNGQRYQSIYKGLAQVFVKPGQTVGKGMVLGSTGQQNLHLETLHQGEAFDPFKAFAHGVSGSWRHKVVQFAKQQLGDPYVLGAEGPNQFDCSGLVQFVYHHMGFALPRTAGEQDLIGHHTTLDRLKPGDLVTWEYGDGDDADHVAIFSGYNHGQPMIIEAPRPGESVRKVPLNWDLQQASFIHITPGNIHQYSEGGRNELSQMGGARMHGGGGGKLNTLQSAIRSQESGGNYQAVNPDSGALGAYQIMPGNFEGQGGWDQEALGRDISGKFFLNHPKAQDRIARDQLAELLHNNGVAGAASAWYSGDPSAWNNRDSQGNYPSIYQYVQDILQRILGQH